MPNLVATLEGTIARLGSQLGVGWPNPWWPNGIPAYNDCAAFISWGLFGLNGASPYNYQVSGVIERSGLEFIPGNQGIRRGDAIGFRWTTGVNYDHIGLALSSPSGLGIFQTIEANGGGNDLVAIHSRSINNVHNYAHPIYLATAALDVTSLGNTTTESDPDMTQFKYVSGLGAATADKRGRVVAYSPGAVDAVTIDQWNQHQAAQNVPVNGEGGYDLPAQLTDQFYQMFLHVESGFPMTWNLDTAPSWRTPSVATLTDAQAATVSTSVATQVIAAQAPTLAAIPNATQLGQALTSTVSLVNAHTDQLKAARTLPAIP